MYSLKSNRCAFRYVTFFCYSSMTSPWKFDDLLFIARVHRSTDTPNVEEPVSPLHLYFTAVLFWKYYRYVTSSAYVAFWELNAKVCRSSGNEIILINSMLYKVGYVIFYRDGFVTIVDVFLNSTEVSDLNLTCYYIENIENLGIYIIRYWEVEVNE